MGDDEDEDDVLEAHYAKMDEEDEQPQQEVSVSQAPTAPTSGESTPGADSVMVMGKQAGCLSAEIG